MVTKIIPELHQSPVQSPGAKSGSLRPGQALSWQPREAGVLALTQGRAWLTFDGPHAGHGNASGDFFLQAGQALELRAGQRVVIETWGPVPVCFEWSGTPGKTRFAPGLTSAAYRVRGWLFQRPLPIRLRASAA